MSFHSQKFGGSLHKLSLERTRQVAVCINRRLEGPYSGALKKGFFFSRKPPVIALRDVREGSEFNPQSSQPTTLMPGHWDFCGNSIAKPQPRTTLHWRLGLRFHRKILNP